jgi:hypothetical protein
MFMLGIVCLIALVALLYIAYKMGIEVGKNANQKNKGE